MGPDSFRMRGFHDVIAERDGREYPPRESLERTSFPFHSYGDSNKQSWRLPKGCHFVQIEGKNLGNGGLPPPTFGEV